MIRWSSVPATRPLTLAFPAHRPSPLDPWQTIRSTSGIWGFFPAVGPISVEVYQCSVAGDFRVDLGSGDDRIEATGNTVEGIAKWDGGVGHNTLNTDIASANDFALLRLMRFEHQPLTAVPIDLGEVDYLDTADRSHLPTSACVGFPKVVGASDVVGGRNSRFEVG